MKTAAALLSFLLISPSLASSEPAFDQGLDVNAVLATLKTGDALPVPASIPGARIDNELQCHYDGDYFYVVDEGVLHKEDVDDGCASAMPECGTRWSRNTEVAALYDCDDLVVYDSRLKTFKRYWTDDNVSDPLLKADEGLAAFYDGDELIVYDADAGDFKKHEADDGYAAASLAVGPGLAAFYDGDELIVYDAGAGDFKTQEVDDNYVGPQVQVGGKLVSFYDGDDFFVYDSAAGSFKSHMADDYADHAFWITGQDGALFYDGDDVYAYCVPASQWKTKNADDNERVKGRARSHSRFLSLFVGDELFSLSTADCDLKKSSLNRYRAAGR